MMNMMGPLCVFSSFLELWNTKARPHLSVQEHIISQYIRCSILYQLQLDRASLRDSSVKHRGPGGKSNESMCMEDNVKLIWEILLSSKEQDCIKKISNSLFSVFRGEDTIISRASQAGILYPQDFHVYPRPSLSAIMLLL